MKAKIKLGYAPTRRAIFSAPAAVEYRKLTAERLRELGIDFVDIVDINEEGLLYDDIGLEKIIEKFRREKVDGLFLPHANFGTEYECARLAKALNVPVLLWGPRDERPDEKGMRLRDSFGDHGMSVRTRRGCVFATASAGCLPPGRSCAASAYLLLI